MQSALQALAAARRGSLPDASHRVTKLLAGKPSLKVHDPQLFRQYHDELLFLSAFPASPQLLTVADRELVRIADDLGQRRAADADSLENSGMANTPVVHSFSIDILRWLTNRRPAATAEFVWNDDSLGAAFDEMLPTLVAPAERDGVLTQRWTTREWLRRARGRNSEIAWVIERFGSLDCPPPIIDRLFESLELNVRWQLSSRGPSRTFLRFPRRPLFWQRDDSGHRVDLQATLSHALPPMAPLRSGDAQRMIDIARSALAVRCRETDPVTYANPAEVTLFHLDRGVDVALIGMQTDRRQSVESFIGFIAARNRVPIAYGGGWLFFERCEIGVNLFPEFRGGESAFIFGQVMRTYAQHFRIKQFTVAPFQFGADNDEAIRSGAFWFYHRLGFRPVDTALRRLADAEHARIQRNREYRTSHRTLRRFTESNLFLNVGGPQPPAKFAPVAPDLIHLSANLTHWLGRRNRRGSRITREDAHRAVVRALDAANPATTPVTTQIGIENLAPLIAMIPKLKSWPARERRDLLNVIRMKGGRRERDFVLALQQQRRLRDAWMSLDG